MNFQKIIQLWPTLTEFAGEVGEDRECVKGWENRNSIPGYAFKAVVAAAENRGFAVTLQDLADAAAASKRDRRRSKTSSGGGQAQAA